MEQKINKKIMLSFDDGLTSNLTGTLNIGKKSKLLFKKETFGIYSDLLQQQTLS